MMGVGLEEGGLEFGVVVVVETHFWTVHLFFGC